MLVLQKENLCKFMRENVCSTLMLLTVISRVNSPTVKASISTAQVLAFTGGGCSGDYGMLGLLDCLYSLATPVNRLFTQADK